MSKKVIEQPLVQSLTATRSLLTEAQGLSTRLALVQEVMIAVNDSLDIDQLLQVVGSETRWLLDFDHCSVCLCLPDGSIQFTNFTPHQPALTITEHSSIQQAINTQQVQLLRHATDTPFASQLIIPLLSGGDVLGTLNFAAREANLYTQDDLRIIYLLGLQLSSSIRNAQRFATITRLYAELDETFKQLREAEQRRDELTSMIVHDLRTPISTMMGYTEMTLAMPDQSSINSTQAAWLEKVLIAGQRTISMINDLLDVHKFDAGEMKVTVEPCDLEALLSVMSEVYKVQAKKADKVFELILPAGTPTLHINKQLIHRVIDNLINNAFKFTDTGGKITLKVSLHSKTMQIMIQDDGIGIAQAHHQTIFDKFAQVTNEHGSALRLGTGLGLTFCRMVIRAHGGDIWVESTPKVGSTFTFFLPLTDIEPVEAMPNLP